MDEGSEKYCKCLYYSANALARQLTKMAEEEFAITGLSPSYAFLLMSINGKPGIQPKELSEHMQLTPSTVTRLVEKLEHKGYVTRTTEGRTTQVYPTVKSDQLNSTIKEAWKGLFDRYSKILGKDEASKLTEEIFEASKLLEG